MTSIEQSMLAAALLVAMFVIAAFYPHEPDLSASTRAMLRGGFEGRSVIVATVEFKTTQSLLKGTL